MNNQRFTGNPFCVRVVAQLAEKNDHRMSERFEALSTIHGVGLFDEMSVIVAPQRVNAFLAHLAVNGIVPSSKSINRPVNSDLRHRPRRRDRYPRTIPRSTFLCRSALADRNSE